MPGASKSRSGITRTRGQHRAHAHPHRHVQLQHRALMGRTVDPGLSNSVVLRFPGVGHGVLPTSGCAQTIMTAFVDSPSSSVDHSNRSGSEVTSGLEARHADEVVDAQVIDHRFVGTREDLGLRGRGHLVERAQLVVGPVRAGGRAAVTRGRTLRARQFSTEPRRRQRAVSAVNAARASRSISSGSAEQGKSTSSSQPASAYPLSSRCRVSVSVRARAAMVSAASPPRKP
ncbi:MAG: conserved hypothetical rane protein [Pseudonocardia sp.]|nr:conserved hypothetical rane protein [Pseudonocardia sp.]